MRINRMMVNICSEDLEMSKNFYSTLFDFSIAYNSNWFVQLVSKDKQLELGIIERSNDLVPLQQQTEPNGFYITIVVESADAVYAIAKENNFGIAEPPKDTAYGQRRLLLYDPNGTLIDVSSPIPDFNF